MSDSRDNVEKLVHAAFEAQRFEHAATLTIEHYGPELLGFLISHLRNEDTASEVFAEFSEAFWEGLPRFEWRCTVRTWAYKLVRRVARRHHKRSRRYALAQPLTQPSQLTQAVERARTVTRAYKRTDVKDRFQELRASLPEDDQTLLVLRVDRGLSWLELAEVMLENEPNPPEDRLKTEAARLRKRFQLAKERLRELVAEAGLLDA